MAKFTITNGAVDLEEITGTGYNQATDSLEALSDKPAPAVDFGVIQGANYSALDDNLHSIKQDAGELNNSILISEYITTNTTAVMVTYKSLTIMNEATLDCDGQNIYVEGDCKVLSGQLINCGSLIVKGNLTVERKIGETYINVFNVNEFHVTGDVSFDHTDLTIDGYFYDGTGANSASTTMQKIGGNLSIENDQSSDQQWFCNQFDIKGDFYCNNTIIEFDTWTWYTDIEHSFLWTIGGDCEFDGLTTLTIPDCYSHPKFSAAGQLIFSESVVTWNLGGTEGRDNISPNDNSGQGGGYIGGAVTSQVAQYNGGGFEGESGAGRGGFGGINATYSGGGGGGASDFTMYYGVGDTGTTLIVNLTGGDGGHNRSGTTGNGGQGGDGGDLTITYDSTAIGTLTTNISGGSNGSSYSQPRDPSSDGTSSHTSGGSPLVIHLPQVPTQVTEDNMTTSILVFNIPVDINNSNLDFVIEIEELLIGTLFGIVYYHNTNDNAGYFSGTAPYTEGTGTITYTPPTGLTVGNSYRWRVTAMKDSDTTLIGLTSPWRRFTYS